MRGRWWGLRGEGGIEGEDMEIEGEVGIEGRRWGLRGRWWGLRGRR